MGRAAQLSDLSAAFSFLSLRSWASGLGDAERNGMTQARLRWFHGAAGTSIAQCGCMPRTTLPTLLLLLSAAACSAEHLSHDQERSDDANAVETRIRELPWIHDY